MTYPSHPAADIFPMLDDVELRALADDIQANGLHEPIWLYADPVRGTVILDGRNRARACELAGVTPETRWYRGGDPIGFTVSENVRRRHLEVGQIALLTLDVERLYAEEAAEKQRAAGAAGAEFGVLGGRPRTSTGRHAVPTAAAETGEAEEPLGADRRQGVSKRPRAPRASDLAGRDLGVSGRAVQRAKRVRDKAPDLAEKVASGEMSLDRADRQVRDREAEQRRIELARAEAAKADVPLTVDIRHGDFREVLADVHDVDAIITDPPYPHEYLPLLADLAAWADKVLTPDGVLVVLMGQTYLPEVYRLLDGHRPYRWTGCYLTPGAGYASHARRLQSNWKPFLVYGGGPRFSDVVSATNNDDAAKSLHRWGQDYDAFRALVERFTRAGQVVADPFMGSGTTLLAARELRRNVIGCDIELESVETTRRRLS